VEFITSDEIFLLFLGLSLSVTIETTVNNVRVCTHTMECLMLMSNQWLFVEFVNYLCVNLYLMTK
jgi:hypothetical protein